LLIKLINSSQESVFGARKFASGIGKHGKFNVNPAVDKQKWEEEYEQMEKEEKEKKK